MEGPILATRPDATDRLLGSFERAYGRGDAEATSDFWRRVIPHLGASRDRVLDSLLEDMARGRDVRPFLETLPPAGDPAWG